MSDGQHLAQTLEIMFTTSSHGWFTPFTEAIAGLSAAQAATVPAEGFNSVWAVTDHVRFWQESALRQLQKLPDDAAGLGSPDGSGWLAIPDTNDDGAWHASQERVRSANHALAQYVAGLSDAELDESVSSNPNWHTRRQVIQSMIAHNSYHTSEVIGIRHMQGLTFGAL